MAGGDISRSALLPFSLAATAAIALATGCYLLFSYGRPIEPDSNVIAATGADSGLTLETLRASQQQATVEQEAIARDVAATRGDVQNTQAGLQKLANQLSVLTAKVDALRDAAAALPNSSIANQPNVRAKAPTKKPAN